MPQISPFKTDLIYALQEDDGTFSFDSVWEQHWILTGFFNKRVKN